MKKMTRPNDNSLLNNVAAQYGFRQHQFPSSVGQQISFPTCNGAHSSASFVCLAFKLYDDDEELTAMVSGKLSFTSTMKDVIEECSIIENLLVYDIEMCKILIKKKNGTYFTFNYKQFHSMTVNKLVNIKNIDDEDYLIVIKK